MESTNRMDESVANSLNIAGGGAGMEPVEMANNIIAELYHKYGNDPNVFAKMHNYICFRLPGIVDEMKRTSDERRFRNELLSSEQDSFICAFLNNNQYFFCPQTDRYFYYNRVHYSLCKEDDILHHILTTITKECHMLMPRKPQTKVYIMKRVKESNPLKSIPESTTIQYVLDLLCPTIFQTKSEAKYFLTILGDHLLKKIDDLTHSYFAPGKSKDFLREIAIAGQTLFGINATGLFKHKYHGHEYQTIRLIKMNESVGVEAVWRPILQNNMIDILCVSAHYSARYESADQYLDNYSDDQELIKYATHFRGKNARDMVSDFIREYIVYNKGGSGSGGVLTNATMEYLFRKYLKDNKLPSVLSPSAFMELIQEMMSSNYDPERRGFFNATSVHLLGYIQFSSFWKNYIVCLSEGESNPLAEYELDEIGMLFRKYNTLERGTVQVARITDSQLLEIIQTYYPSVEIVDEKYLQGIKCTMWNKVEELNTFFDVLRQELLYIEATNGSKPSNTHCVSIYNAYSRYQKYAKETKKTQIISKSFFEKYVAQTMGEFILDGKYISSNWL